MTPFNVLPMANAADNKHPGSTPLSLVDLWVRYISPPGGMVADWFAGSGTVGLAALRHGRSFVGIERNVEYCAMAETYLSAEQGRYPLFEVPRPVQAELFAGMAD